MVWQSADSYKHYCLGGLGSTASCQQLGVEVLPQGGETKQTAWRMMVLVARWDIDESNRRRCICSWIGDEADVPCIQSVLRLASSVTSDKSEITQTQKCTSIDCSA